MVMNMRSSNQAKRHKRVQLEPVISPKLAPEVQNNPPPPSQYRPKENYGPKLRPQVSRMGLSKRRAPKQIIPEKWLFLRTLDISGPRFNFSSQGLGQACPDNSSIGLITEGVKSLLDPQRIQSGLNSRNP